MDLAEKGWEGVDWMHMIQNNDHWRAFVGTVMNFLFP
jgi:hypothetical protein